MGKYNIVRLDCMSGNRDNALPKSGMYFKDGVKAAVENGTIVAVKKLLDGEREIHEVVDATADDVAVGIVTTPEVIYDERGIGDGDLGNFINEADEPIRVHIFHPGDFFSVTKAAEEDMVLGAKLVGEYQGNETVGRYVYKCFEVKAV